MTWQKYCSSVIYLKFALLQSENSKNMNVSYNKNTAKTDELDTISLDSNEYVDLSFEDEELEQQKTPKECFKTIYGLG